jgi:hypothetical protein
MTHRSLSTTFFAVSAALIGAVGCLSTADPVGDGDMDVVGGTGAVAATGGSSPIGSGGAVAATGGAVAGTGGAVAGTGGGFVEPEPLPVDLFLPVTLTDSYAPTGFMGKLGTDPDMPGTLDPTMDEVTSLVMDEAGCPERPADAVGLCYKVTWTPLQLAADGGTWVGAYFQGPAGEANWGTVAGPVIEQGATKISFNAWTDTGESLDLEFFAGGIGDLGSAFADSFSTKVLVTVGDDIAASGQEINLVGQPYEMVIGGFGWALPVTSLDPIVFYLDNVVWEK